MHSELVQPNFIEVDTEFKKVDSENQDLVGVVVTATGANAVVDIFDGNPGTQKIQLKIATNGDGREFTFGGVIRFGTSIRVDLTNCNATIFRRINT